MRLGIVSDTHLRSGQPLPPALIAGLQGVDFILHAGDWISADVIDLFANIAPIDGVAGNNDGYDIIDRFGLVKVLELDRYRVGIVHGDGFRTTTQLKDWEPFVTEKVDIIIFGHSHIPLQVKHDGVLLFNPGSPTDKRRQPQYSYGIIELGDEIVAQHYYFDHSVIL